MIGTSFRNFPAHPPFLRVNLTVEFKILVSFFQIICQIIANAYEF